MYHICRYSGNCWNIYNDSPSSSTDCYDDLQKALSEPFRTTRHSLKELEKKYGCKSIFSVDSLSDIERLYPECLI